MSNKHVKPGEKMTDQDYFMLEVEKDTPMAAALRFIYAATLPDKK